MIAVATLTWDDAKRDNNLRKHGLDFVDAVLVIDSPYRLDVPTTRSGEQRVQMLAYVFEMLAVLSVIAVSGDDAVRIVSFRRASAEEREAYHEWLETDFDEDR